MKTSKLSPDFSSNEPWVAVRCLFSHPKRATNSDHNLYEERVTLWKARNFNEAFDTAEREARLYAASEDCVFIQALDAFHLFDTELKSGMEVWALMRGSGMEPEVYASTFCSTPRDRVAYRD